MSGASRSARIGTCELGRPLVSSVGLASCPPSRDRTGRRTRPYAALHPMFWCGGLTCREPNPGVWWTSHPGGVDGGSIGALELRSSGARQRPVKRGRRPAPQLRPSRKRADHYEHEACGTEAHQRCDSPPLEAEQRNHSGRRHLPDRIVSRSGRDARFRGGYLGPVGCAGSTVTPRNS